MSVLELEVDNMADTAAALGPAGLDNSFGVVWRSVTEAALDFLVDKSSCLYAGGWSARSEYAGKAVSVLVPLDYNDPRLDSVSGPLPASLFSAVLMSLRSA